MAKGNSGGEDRAKVKLRVIEFELEGANSSVENSIRQLTAALSVRTNGTPKLPPNKPTKELASGDAGEQEHQESVELEAEVVEEGAEAPPAKTKIAKPKAKPKPPNYLHDLVKDSNSLKASAAEKKPASKSRQYLTAMYWFKEMNGTPIVNIDSIYTFFKTAGWSVGFNDWAQPFHNLVHEDLIRKSENKGEFTINPTGEDVVKSLPE